MPISVSAIQRTIEKVDVHAGKPYPLIQFTLDGISVDTSIDRVLLVPSTTLLADKDEGERHYDLGSALSSSTIADDGGGDMQVTVTGAAGSETLFSSTVGHHGHEVHASFTDGSTPDGWLRVSGVATSGGDLVLTLDVAFDAAVSAVTLHRNYEGALTSGQGSSGSGRTGMLYIDKHRSHDLTAGAVVYLYIEGSTEPQDDYTLWIMEVDGSPLATPLRLGDSTVFSLRPSLTATAVRYAQDGSAVAVSDDDSLYFYPGSMPTDANGHTQLLTLTVTGGQPNFSVFVTEDDNDGAKDILEVYSFDDAMTSSTTTTVYLPSTATAGVDYSRSYSATVNVAVFDDVNRTVELSFTVAILTPPAPSLVINAARTGLDSSDQPAFAYVGGTHSIPIAVVTVDAHSGAAATLALTDDNFEANSTMTVTVSDNGSGKVRATFATSGDAHAVGVGLYLDNLSVRISGYSGDLVVTEVASDGSYVDCSGTAVVATGAAVLTMAATNTGYLALQDGVVSAGAPSYTLPSAITVQENGFTFTIDASEHVVRLFQPAITSDFVTTLVRDNSYPWRAVSSGPVNRLEAPWGAALVAKVTWDADFGIDVVSAVITGKDLAVTGVVQNPGGTDLSGSFANPVLRYSSPTTAAASAGASGVTVTLVDETEAGETPGDLFVAGNHLTRYMEMQVAFTITNSLSDAVASIGDVTFGEKLRLYQPLALPSSVQTRFHMDITDTTGEYQDGTALLPYTHTGGNLETLSDTTMSSAADLTTHAANLQADDANDAVELLDASPTTFFSTANVDDVTVTDLSTSGAGGSVTLDSFTVYHYAVLGSTLETSSPVLSVPTSGEGEDTLVNTAAWTSTSLSHQYGDGAVSGGHSLNTNNTARCTRSISGLTYSSSTRLDVVLADGSEYEVEGRSVRIVGSTSYDGLYSVAAGSTTSLVRLTPVSPATISDSLSSETGMVHLLDSTLGRGLVTLTIDGTTAGNDGSAALFDFLYIDSGSQYHAADNGESSALRVRLTSTDISNYNGTTFKLRVSFAEFSLQAGDAADGSVGNGQSGSLQLWPEFNLDMNLSFSSASWSLTEADGFAESRLTNFQPAVDTLDPDGTLYEDAAHATQLRLLNEQNVTVEDLIDDDKFAVVLVKVSGADETTVDSLLSTGWGADNSEQLKYSNMLTSSTRVDARASSGAYLSVNNGVNNAGSVVGSHSADVGASSVLANGGKLSVIIDPDVAADGDLFALVLLTSIGVTLSGSTIANQFIRLAEVRYSGGIESFVLSRRDAMSYPGATSFNLSAVTATNQAGTAILTSTSAIEAATYDYTLQATMGSSLTTIDPASASTDTWRLQISSGTGVTYSQLRQALQRLPEVVCGSYSNAAYDSGDKDQYNTANGMDYSASVGNTTVRRVYYRLGLRLATAANRETNTEGGLSTSDDDYAWYAVSGNATSGIGARSGSTSASFTALGSFMRFTATDDGQHALLAGLEPHVWTDIHSSPTGDVTVYAFSNVPWIVDGVDNDSILSGSAP